MSRGDASGTIFTFILGLSVGALAALLFAPKAGEEMRGDIGTGVTTGVSKVRNAGKKLHNRTQKIVAMAEDHAHDALEAGQEAYSQAKKA
jgi:gas vesicle protein